MVLAGRPMEETLSAVEQVLEHERQEDRLFTTLCVLSVTPDRTAGRLHLAGHPPPVLISADGVSELAAPACLPVGIGTGEARRSSEVTLGSEWSVLMYTDGLIEGKIGPGPERLGSDGLMTCVTDLLAARQQAPAQPASDQSAAGQPAGDQSSADQPATGQRRDEWLLDALMTKVREINGGELDDDLAMLALGHRPAGRAADSR
jgi:serine phosphatase RsbU (regulator of sigma subunit)